MREKRDCPGRKLGGEVEAAFGRLCAVRAGQRCRYPKEVATALLLKDPVMRAGVLLETRARSVGAGVYEVWLEPVQFDP